MINKSLKYFFAIVFTFTYSSLLSYDAQSAINESDLKSVYLYKMLKFIQWESQGTSKKQLHICFYSTKGHLKESLMFLEGKQTNKLSLKVNTIKKRKNLTKEKTNICDLLYLDKNTKINQTQLDNLNLNKQIIITEFKPSSKIKGDINFFIKEKSLLFEISRKREDYLGIKFSASLLLLAASVK